MAGKRDVSATDEADMLCDPETRQWLEAHHFALAAYEPLARGK